MLLFFKASNALQSFPLQAERSVCRADIRRPLTLVDRWRIYGGLPHFAHNGRAFDGNARLRAFRAPLQVSARVRNRDSAHTSARVLRRLRNQRGRALEGLLKRYFK